MLHLKNMYRLQISKKSDLSYKHTLNQTSIKIKSETKLNSGEFSSDPYLLLMYILQALIWLLILINLVLAVTYNHKTENYKFTFVVFEKDRKSLSHHTTG